MINFFCRRIQLYSINAFFTYCSLPILTFCLLNKQSLYIAYIPHKDKNTKYDYKISCRQKILNNIRNIIMLVEKTVSSKFYML